MIGGRIILFRTNPALAEKSAPRPERVTKGTPSFHSWNHYADAKEKFFSGEWQAEPGAWRIEYDETEFCHILEGVSVIHADAGETVTLRAGDSFVIPAGFKGEWEVIERTKKLYVIVYL